MQNVTIYHNPRCSKSRQTLALLQSRGIEPDIIEYLKNPPTIHEIENLIAMLETTPRGIMRHNEEIYSELNLDSPKHTEYDLVKAIADHPILLERPIVIVDDKAAIGRPPENVLLIL